MTTSTATFVEKFRSAAERNHSLLCVGLDPDPTKLPAGVSTRDFLMGVVEATADLVCCFKPNIAFFEPDLAEGITLLKDLIAAVPNDVPVLLDAKRGDIGHTAEAYVRAVYDSLKADAVTLNPYLGRDSLEPFLRREDRHAFLLCRTSNASAGDLQDLPVDGGMPLFEKVAHLSNEWNDRGNIGLVLGATYPAEAARIRAICPDMIFLMPGVGAQQAEIDAAVQAASDASGGGIIVNASRGVLYPAAPDGDWIGASRAAARTIRDQINAARPA